MSGERVEPVWVSTATGMTAGDYAELYRRARAHCSTPEALNDFNLLTAAYELELEEKEQFKRELTEYSEELVRLGSSVAAPTNPPRYEYLTRAERLARLVSRSAK